MFEIFADTHKIIASNIFENIYQIYGIELDKKRLLKGSVAPDILPKYRFHKHYKDESLNYIVNEIVKLIFISKALDFNEKIDPIRMKILSYNLGVISHYLSDFVCLPHAQRWTFYKNLMKHVNYETKLNEYAPYHNFKKNIITVNDMDIFKTKKVRLKPILKDYIEEVIKEHSFYAGFKGDLDFALSLSLKISYFVIDTVKAYSHEAYKDFAFIF
ncbi:MAG: zinc dependent phospholipase C family protein [Tissierellia bacterium]|nr:zinc dependent phospholipase C family protein [Tissierellia bacterium]